MPPAMLHKVLARWHPLPGDRELARTVRTLRAARAAQRDAVRKLAHDLKNPLGSVLLMAQLLEEAGGDPETVRITGRIQRQCHEMNRLVDLAADTI